MSMSNSCPFNAMNLP
uniref:Uncharacterized protein n=1 Tax=Arundo donax TaxID=35708 RepID=A0A0A9BT57_ARUDO